MLRSCSVETYFLTERGNHRLQVSLSSDSDRISHGSSIFEKFEVGDNVSARYAVRVFSIAEN